MVKAGKSGGGKLTAVLGSVFGKGAKTVGAAGAVALGTALFKGFQRLSAIDEAKAKLTGLGNSTKTVDTIMTNALASVKGTAFGLGDAATVAATAVAAGIKPGRELEGTLRLVADAATIGGTSLGEMGQIFSKVATSNKLQGDTINQLNERGIPIVQLLAKSMGKTSEEVVALASKGKIGFAQFQTAMESGLGGSALKSGETFKGALANVGAALGRVGAALLTGLFPIAKQVFAGITGFLDGVTAKVGPFADAFAAKLPGAFAALGAAFGKVDFGSIGGKLKPLVEAFKDFAGHVISAATKVGPALLSIAKGLAPLAKLAVGVAITALTVAFRALGPVLDTAASAFAGVVDFVKNNETTFKVLAATIGVVLLPVLIQSAAAAIASGVATLTMNAAWLVYGITVKAISVATKVFTAGQWLLNAALSANPIGLVIVVIAALVAGLVIAYKKSETFRAIVSGAMKAVGAIFTWLWNNAARPALIAIGFALGVLMSVWAKMLHALGKVPGFGWAKKAGDAMQGAANKALNLGDSLKKIPNKTHVSASEAGFQHVIDMANKMNRAVSASNLARIHYSTGSGGAGGIPMNAAGTDNWRGGGTWVGEEGPEWVNLPRGSQIIPNHKIGDIGDRGSSSAAAAPVNFTYNASDGPSLTAEERLFKAAASARFAFNV